ncbi:MAG: hypothetical protein ACK5T2_18725 [bacterium]|jgi:hypothetical protein|nr:hypothetical protein [Betaproteobacteria bacterium]
MVTPGGGRQVAVSIDTGRTAREQRVEASIQGMDHGLARWQRLLSMSAVAAVMSREALAATLDPPPLRRAGAADRRPGAGPRAHVRLAGKVSESCNPDTVSLQTVLPKAVERTDCTRTGGDGMHGQ